MAQSGRGYNILEILGEGSWGKVYSADGPRGRVALKFLRPELGDRVRRHFQAEVQLLSRLSHPNLVQIYDYLPGDPARPTLDHSGPAFAMEFLQGRDLEGLFRPSAEQILDLFAQTCRGLAYLHRRQIFHRDLKPSNLFLTRDGDVKILDFGLAIEGGGTAAEAPIGTFAFAAPETYLGDFDARSDLFSLGALFYRVASGQIPFSRPLLPSTLAEFPVPVPLQSLRPDLPEYFCDLVHRLLSPVPSERPASAKSLLRFLALHRKLDDAEPDPAEQDPWDEKIPLVGRRAELASFQQALRPDRDEAKPRTLAITGPTGVGRSRLLEEFKWQALLQGNLWIPLRPEDSETWLSRLRVRLGLAETLEASSLIEEVSGLLDALERTPNILACSDLQDWSNVARDRLALLLSLAREQNRRLFVVTEWNSDRLAAHDWEDRLQALDLDLETMRLNDLEPGACLQLIKLAAGDRKIPGEALAQIAETSGGRPILALAGLREFATGERSPATLLEVAQRQIQSLDEESQMLLALLCLHPQPVSMAEIVGLEASSGTSWEDSLLTLQERGMLNLRSDDLWQFRHGSLVKAYRECLPEPIRRGAHLLWLKFLRPRSPDSEKSPELLLALVSHALAIADTETLATYGIAALQILERRGELVRMLHWSAALLKVPSLEIDRVWIFALRGPALYRLGRFDEALEAYRFWREIREDDGSGLVPTRYHFYRGLVYFTAGERDKSAQELQLALQSGDGQSQPSLRPWQARAHNLLAALAEKTGGHADAHAHLLSALALAQSDPALLGETEQRLGILEQSRLDYSAAEHHFKNSLAEYRKVKNPQIEAIALNFLAMLDRERGALASAESWLHQSLALAREGGELLQYARYLGNLALLQIERGNLASARESLQEAQPLVSALGHSEDKAILAIAWALLFSHSGNDPQTQRWLEKLDAELEKAESPELRGARALLDAEVCYGRKAWEAARSGYRAAMALADVSEIFRCHARLGLLKAEARGGDRRALREALQDFPPPVLGQASLLSTLLAFYRFVTEPAEAQSKEGLRAILNSLQSLENPWQRRDCLLLLAAYFSRGGLDKIGRKIFLAYREISEQIRNQLPEEMKMDFEKNQSLRSLEEALEGKPSQAKPADSPISAKDSPAAATRSQISEARFRQFCEINRQISEKTDLNEILERVMDAAIELTGAERGFLLLKDEKQKSEPFRGFQIKTARRIKHQAIQEEEFQFSLGAVKEAFAQGIPLVTNNASVDPRFQEMRSVVQYQLKSILVVPLEVGAEPFGAIYLDHRFEPDCFASQDVVLLSGFASQATLAIQKAQMIAALNRAKENLEEQVQEQAQHIEVLNEELSQKQVALKYEYPEIIGRSAAMMRVFQLLDHVTQTKIPVWIFGESGTGKELIARSLHFNSPRKKAPFVTENCSAIPENLLESELFGFKRGAFSQADRDRIGLFEMANGGTLFLDEVADMSLAMQAKLLRVLQEGEVRPLGSNKTVKIDVRLVTASNRDLRRMVQEEKFRQDLFFRINGMTVPLPPLRERLEDIPLLVHFLTKKIAKEYGLKPSAFQQDAIQVLMRRTWPGNIRELEGAVRNALLFAGGKSVTGKMLLLSEGIAPAPLALESGAAEERPSSETNPPILDARQDAERKKILSLARKHGGDKNRIAEELGVSLKSVYNMMDRYGIPKKKSQLQKFLRG
ncbi:MAG: sigma 54-interacting transcriptional regulator [bacterium]